MVDHKLNHHLHTTLMRGIQESFEVIQRAIRRVHIRVVSNVVAIVAQRGRKERQDPDAGNAEVFQVIETRQQTCKITDPVIVRIGKCANMQFVYNRIFVPEWIRCAGNLFHTFISVQFVQYSIMTSASREIYAPA